MPTFLNSKHYRYKQQNVDTDDRYYTDDRYNNESSLSSYGYNKQRQSTPPHRSSSSCANAIHHVNACDACRSSLWNASAAAAKKTNNVAAAVDISQLTREQIESIVIDKNLFNAATAAQASMWLTLASIIVMILVRNGSSTF